MPHEDWTAAETRLRLGERGQRCPACYGYHLFFTEARLYGFCLRCKRIFDGAIFATYTGNIYP